MDHREHQTGMDNGVEGTNGDWRMDSVRMWG